MKDFTTVRYTTNIINIKTEELISDLSFFSIIGVSINYLKKRQDGKYVLEKKDLVYSNLPAHTIKSIYQIADSVAENKESYLDNIRTPFEYLSYAKRFLHYIGNDEVMCIYINLTQEKKQTETYELIAKLYNFTTKSGNVSPFYVDFANSPDKLWGSDQTANFLNVKPNKDMYYNVSDWSKQVILANGEQRANEIISHFQDAVSGKVKEYSVKYQMFDNDGNKIWYHSLSNLIERDENGVATAFYGLNIQIDELVRSQQKLEKSEERLRLATESTKISTWEYDVVNDTGYLSEKLAETFGCDTVQPNIIPVLMGLMHPDQLGVFKSNLKEQMNLYDHYTIYNYQLRTKKGDYIWVSISAKITKSDEAGNPTHMVGIVWDIDNQRKREEELKKQNITDELTGLYNAKYLKKYIDTLTQNGNIEFTLAFANVKNFRAINELYGYEFGDKALKVIANKLKKDMPKNTAFFRDSGDEFVLISTTKSQYYSLLNNGITDEDTKRAKMDIEVDGVILTIEFNRGIILYPYHSNDISEVINLAK